MSNWSFTPNDTDTFAETSENQLKVDCFKYLLLQQREGCCPLWGAWGLLYNPAGVFFLSLWCSRWVFRTGERWERWFSGTVGLTPYSNLNFLEASLQSLQKITSWPLEVSGEDWAPRSRLGGGQCLKSHHTTGLWSTGTFNRRLLSVTCRSLMS